MLSMPVDVTGAAQAELASSVKYFHIGHNFPWAQVLCNQRSVFGDEASSELAMRCRFVLSAHCRSYSVSDKVRYGRSPAAVLKSIEPRGLRHRPTDSRGARCRRTAAFSWQLSCLEGFRSRVCLQATVGGAAAVAGGQEIVTAGQRTRARRSFPALYTRHALQFIKTAAGCVVRV